MSAEAEDKGHDGTVLTVRDMFAMAALEGRVFTADSNKTPKKQAEQIAKCCYQIADAMLKARETP